LAIDITFAIGFYNSSYYRTGRDVHVLLIETTPKKLCAHCTVFLRKALHQCKGSLSLSLSQASSKLGGLPVACFCTLGDTNSNASAFEVTHTNVFINNNWNTDHIVSLVSDFGCS